MKVEASLQQGYARSEALAIAKYSSATAYYYVFVLIWHGHSYTLLTPFFLLFRFYLCSIDQPSDTPSDEPSDVPSDIPSGE